MNSNQTDLKLLRYIDCPLLSLDSKLVERAPVSIVLSGNTKFRTPPQRNRSLVLSKKTYGRIITPSNESVGVEGIPLGNEKSKLQPSERDVTCNFQGNLRLPMKRTFTGLIDKKNEMNRCGPKHPIDNIEENVLNKEEDFEKLSEVSESFEAYSDASSDGFSVDEALSWKNDQNRGERLLPLKRLKKGYSSACKRTEPVKTTDWTDNVTIYDNIISVALDHSNYARSPIHNLPTSPESVNLSSIDAPKPISNISVIKRIDYSITDNILPKEINDESPPTLTEQINESQSTISCEKPKEENINVSKLPNIIAVEHKIQSQTTRESAVATEIKKTDQQIIKKNKDLKISNRPRGRPKGSFKIKRCQNISSVRSYRFILRRSRMGRPIRNAVRDIGSKESKSDEFTKRPVGRPRKCGYEVPRTQPSTEKQVNSSLSEKIKKLKEKLSMKDSTVRIEQIGYIKESKSELEIPKHLSNSQIEKTPEEESNPEETLSLPDQMDSNENQVKDRLLSMVTSTMKRPKGRPRSLLSLDRMNKEIEKSQLKRKRGRPPKLGSSLLQGMKNSDESCQVSPSVEMSDDDNQDNSNSSKDTTSTQPTETLTPTNWLSQLSRRSSLRQVECAFRYREIVVKKQENFIHIVLTSNTRVKNGLNCQVLCELKTALMSAKNDSKCHCVMLSGTGGVFCSGVDLISLSVDKTKSTADKMSCAIRDFCKSLMTFPKPLVAAVNGSAVGLGVAMLPYFDLVYATDKATFYSPYAKLGQVPEGGATFLLPTVMGYARANGLLLEGRKLTATEAYDCGIVTQVLWPATFMEEVIPRVQALSSRPLQALESTKALVRYHAMSKLEVTLDTECRLLFQHWSSDECRQIIKDFLQNEEVV